MKNIAFFEKKNIEGTPSGFETLRKLLDENYFCYRVGEADIIPDLIVVIGGDGTILRTASYAVRTGAPILAINAGTVGFLSSYESGDVEKCVEDIKNDELTISERSVLSVKAGKNEYIALNDAVVERDRSIDGKTIVTKLDVSIDGQLVYNLSADGVIVATPTGSTAYSLSAGGVILAPDLKSFIVTPICSHALGTRPVVFNDESKLGITVGDNSCDCVLSVDGRPVEKLRANSSVTISKYVKSLKIVDNNSNFYKRLHCKL